jgi:hypothetical protein
MNILILSLRVFTKASCVVHEVVSHVTLCRMRELLPPPLHYLPKINGSKKYFSNSPWAVSKRNSSELLTKRAREKNYYLHMRNTYILKLLLDVVTVGIEALFMSEIFVLRLHHRRLPPVSSSTFGHRLSTSH